MADNIEIPVVAVGASAGGIEALKTFVEHLPDEPGCAFVVLQHLAPDHESQLTAILSRASRLPVREADHDLTIEPNSIYVLPPNRYLRIADHGLFVEPPDAPRGLRMVIDYFMRSLAKALGPRAVGVVLSGTGSDGSAGLREIRAAGGLALAQSPETALYDGMPSAAIDQGVVDYIGPIDELVGQVLSFANEFALPREGDGEIGSDQIKAVVAVLKARTGHDFGAYKPGTTLRRVTRRMNLLRFDKFDDYLSHLRATPSECDQLFHDLLINVTSFFRDPAVWGPIGEILEQLLSSTREEPIRVWAPACAGGEEAYSLAILFEEICETIGSDCRWQIFATDLDPDAVATAREGLYPFVIESDVTPERLRKRFRKEAHGYRVEKTIRERVVFAQQNLLTDPPFSRLDVVVCRNLLIYLTSPTQSRLLDLFHFALVDNGYLILGTSETAGQRQRHFKTVSSQAHIYQRLPGQTYRTITPATDGVPRRGGLATRLGTQRPRATGRDTLAENVRRSLLIRFGPASAVVDADGEVAFFHGSIRRFLDTPEGEPSHNLFDLLGPSLRVRVREAVREAGESPGAELKVKRARMPDSEIPVRIECERLAGEERELFLVSFIDEPGATGPQVPREAIENESDYVRQLEHELLIVREDLQTTIEELETSNEELKASNEEAMAANEELQSTNEELETSREELQSLNEELVTVNSQLEDKLEELERATSDLGNLFASTRLPVLFLGTDLAIRSFTPTISEVVEIRAGDQGRPISDFAFKVNDPDLLADARHVLTELGKSERQVATTDGHIYLRRVQPYRTNDERISGVVISYTEITTLVQTAERLAQRERQQRTIAELGQSALVARSIQALLDDACIVIRSALDCDFVRVLEARADLEGNFLLRAGTGWKPGVVGKAIVENSPSSFSGFTMASGGAVVVEDFESEDRTAPTQVLVDHGVKSGMSTRITVGGTEWGLISAHSKTARKFNEDDLSVLTAAANILSQALTQIAREDFLAGERLTLDLALNAADLGVWTWEPGSDAAVWDDRLRAMVGFPTGGGRAKGEDFFAVIDGADRERVRAELKKTGDTGAPFASEYRVDLPDGSQRWLAARGARIPGSSPPRLTGVNYDVTDRKATEDRQQLIMRELDHRVKNMLAIILSIGKLTARNANGLDDFLDGFTNRIQAMARTHALLSDSRWRGITLRNLMEDELAQYRSRDMGNVSLDGPDIVLSPEAGQSLSMAIHELATNAAKYGALSTPGGRLMVRWSHERRDEGNVLLLNWSEREGPPVKRPSTNGFGTTVLNQILTSQLRADVDQRFPKAGMELRIAIPADAFSIGHERRRTLSSMPARDVDLSVLAGRSVIILDDEWLIGEEHRMALETANARIVGTFTDIPSTSAALDEALPDIAILDFNIAGEPVTPIASRLLKAGVPVIIVTGYGSSLTVPDELSGAVMMHKPVTIGALVRHAAALLDRVPASADAS